MAANIEVNTIHRVLRKFGCTEDGSNQAHVGTLRWVTNAMGLSSAAVFNAMSKPILESTFKRLSKDAVNVQVVNDRPNDNIRTMKATTNIVLGVRCFSGRGVPMNQVMLKLDHDNAVRFIELCEVHCQKEVDKDDKIELPVLKSGVRMNSACFLDWLEQLKTDLRSVTSVDGVGTLAANLRVDVDPMAWDDVDMTWNLDKIADSIAPLGGKTFQDDEARVCSGLVKALEHAGSSHAEKYKQSRRARPLIDDLKTFFYPEGQIELQVKGVEKTIDGSFWKSEGIGHPWANVVNQHRKGHLKLAELGRPWPESKKVMCLIAAIRTKTEPVIGCVGTDYLCFGWYMSTGTSPVGPG